MYSRCNQTLPDYGEMRALDRKGRGASRTL